MPGEGNKLHRRVNLWPTNRDKASWENQLLFRSVVPLSCAAWPPKVFMRTSVGNARWLVFVLLPLLSGCLTNSHPLPATDFSAPGWITREGQAVWRRSLQAPELAGELLVARSAAGDRTLVQFSKTPLPLLTAQTVADGWQIIFVPQARTFSGTGRPSPRLLWLHLADGLAGVKLPEPLRFSRPTGDGWQIENRRTGEMISGYLNP